MSVPSCESRRAEPRLERMQTRLLLPGLLALALGAVLGAASCDDADTITSVCPVLTSECPAVLPSYTNEVAPIIATHCGQCHTHADPTGPWPLDDPTDVADWSIQIQLDLSDCLMPPEDTDVPLSAADRDTLHTWLMCGAPLN